MPSTYMVQKALEFVSAGGFWLLARFKNTYCEVAPSTGTMELRLFQNDIVPGCNTELSDLTEATFDGYAAIAIAQPCTGVLQGVALDTDGNFIIPVDMQEFAMTGATTPNTIYGWYLVETSATEELIAIGRFAEAPLTMDENGDKIKVQAGEGYCSNVKDLLILTDNGNGYFVKRKSYVSTEADQVFNLDYAALEYLYFAYKAILEKEG